MDFYAGIFNVSHCWPFKRVMVSINRIIDRKSSFIVNDWLLDSGAFTELTNHGRYRSDPEEYADHVNRWSSVGNMLAASTQDYMCEPFVVERTGLSVREHQLLTIERFERIIKKVKGAYVMPVIQGYNINEYERHVDDYGSLLKHGAWVGVGSVCKRNSRPQEVESILSAILAKRPDLRLHGFGLKIEAIRNHNIREMLHSSDSMAWSFEGRRSNVYNAANDPRNALKYCSRVQDALAEPQFIDPQLLFDWWK